MPTTTSPTKPFTAYVAETIRDYLAKLGPEQDAAAQLLATTQDPQLRKHVARRLDAITDEGDKLAAALAQLPATATKRRARARRGTRARRPATPTPEPAVQAPTTPTATAHVERTEGTKRKNARGTNLTAVHAAIVACGGSATTGEIHEATKDTMNYGTLSSTLAYMLTRGHLRKNGDSRYRSGRST